MMNNLNSLHGVVFSQSVLLSLVNNGFTRDDAYRIVQENARTAIETQTAFKDVLKSDKRVTLSAAELDNAFDTQRVLRHAGRAVDALKQIAI
jgi:adenylosuccinate lyase